VKQEVGDMRTHRHQVDYPVASGRTAGAAGDEYDYP
jgi:hypothetical protein